jgi:hypothetical protein
MGTLRNIWLFVNAMAILLIVYVDLAFWSAYGPNSDYQKFPVIYLIIVPIMLIAFSLLWGKIPKPE